MGMKVEFNWYLVSSNKLESFNKGETYTMTKDEERVYPIGMPIPYIEKETGCRGLAEVIKYSISDNKTKIVFKCVDIFAKDYIIAKHYYDMYKQMKNKAIDKMVNDDVNSLVPKEAFDPKTLPIFKMSLKDIHMQSTYRIHYDRLNTGAGLADVAVIKQSNNNDELFILCKFNGYSLDVYGDSDSYILVFDKNGDLFYIIKKPSAEIDEFITMFVFLKSLFINNTNNCNFYVNNKYVYNIFIRELSDFKSINIIE